MAMLINDSIKRASLSIANLPTGGVIGTAAATVDLYSQFVINQTTNGQTISLPNPTDATSSDLVEVVNKGSVAFTINGIVVPSNFSSFLSWNGTTWNSLRGHYDLATLNTVDLGYIVGWGSNSLPPNYLLPLSGGTFLWSDYPDFQSLHAVYPNQFIASVTATTFTLANINTAGRFLRGGVTTGVQQNDSTKTPNAGWTVSGAVANGTTNPTTGGTAQNQFGLIQVSGGGSNTTDGILDASPGEPNLTQAPFNHNHTVTGGDAETRPLNVSVIWCIKVKPTAGTSNVTINTLPANNGSVSSISAKGEVLLSDLSTSTLSNTFNVASATIVSGSGSGNMIMQITFTTPLATNDYIVTGEVLAQAAEAAGSNATLVWETSTKTTNGFRVIFRETIGATQNCSFVFNVNQKATVAGTPLVAGANISIIGDTISATSTVLSGNIIAMLEKALTLNEVTFGNLKMRWNAASDRYEVATVAGTEVLEWTTRINYGGQSTVVNGGAGVDGTVQGTPITATTAFQVIGDTGILGIEDRTYNIWTAGSLHYRVNTIRKGTTTTDGWSTFIVEQIGIATTAPITATNGTTISGSNVKLGTPLTENTDIPSGGFNMALVNGTGVLGIGTTAATPKVGAATTPSKVNVEYSSLAETQAGIDVYNANNGVAVTTMIRLWNTDSNYAELKLNNASYTGIGGPRGLVLNNRLNAPTVIGTNNLVRVRVSAGGTTHIGTNPGGDAQSTLQVTGSVQYTPVTLTLSGTQDITHFDVYLSSASVIVYTLLAPSISLAGRVIRITNISATTAQNITGNIFGVAATTLPIQAGATIELVCDSTGTTWTRYRRLKAHVRAFNPPATTFSTTAPGTLLNFGVNRDDTGSYSAGSFTAPENGYYLFKAQVMLATTTGAIGARAGIVFSINGAGGFGGAQPFDLIYFPTANPTMIPIKAVQTIYLTKGQIVTARGFLDTATAATTFANSFYEYLQIDYLD